MEENIFVIWIGLGLLGSFVFFWNSAEKGRGFVFAVFSLLHAVIFGPIFLPTQLR